MVVIPYKKASRRLRTAIVDVREAPANDDTLEGHSRVALPTANTSKVILASFAHLKSQSGQSSA